MKNTIFTLNAKNIDRQKHRFKNLKQQHYLDLKYFAQTISNLFPNQHTINPYSRLKLPVLRYKDQLTQLLHELVHALTLTNQARRITEKRGREHFITTEKEDMLGALELIKPLVLYSKYPEQNKAGHYIKQLRTHIPELLESGFTTRDVAYGIPVHLSMAKRIIICLRVENYIELKYIEKRVNYYIVRNDMLIS